MILKCFQFFKKTVFLLKMLIIILSKKKKQLKRLTKLLVDL